MERTVTSFRDDHLLRTVPPTAAHYVAPVHPHGRVIAQPPVRPQNAQFGVPLAETGRHLVIDEILNTWRFVFGIEGFQLETVFVLPPVLPLAVDAVGDAVQLRVFGGAVGMGVVGGAVVAHIRRRHVGRSVEAILQEIADDPERRQTHPAGFHRART